MCSYISKNRNIHVYIYIYHGIDFACNDIFSLTVEWMQDIWRYTGRVNEGYGSTEVGAIASHGTLNAGVRIRLEDCPEMGYTSKV